MHDLIASRVLDTSDGRTFEIFVGLPAETGKGDFKCPYRIKSEGYDMDLQSVGADRVQALALALRSIGSQLDVIEESENIKIYWLDEHSSHGFPSI